MIKTRRFYSENGPLVASLTDGQNEFTCLRFNGELSFVSASGVVTGQKERSLTSFVENFIIKQ